MRPFLLTIVLFFFLDLAYSQNVNKEVELRKLKINEYYTAEEADSTIFNPNDLSVTPLSTDDINSDFSNINNLYFLKNIPSNNRVLLIGESHYSTYIKNIINRIIFSINRIDYYPLVIIEKQYSYTPYINYFINIADDTKAIDFFSSTLTDFVNTKDDSVFCEHLRRWNKLYPHKKIAVGFTDLEFDTKRTFDKILKPYFSKLKVDKNDLDSIFSLNLSEKFFARIQPLLDMAAKVKLVGDFPFIDIKYITNVVVNLKYTNYFFDDSNDRGQFGFFYRQKGITRNLTDDNVFGNILKKSKVIIYGGGYHATNHIQHPEGGNMFREGSYLTFEYPPTKGRTYSIMLEGLAFKLGDMYKVSLENKSFGSQYGDIVKRLKKAYEQNLISADSSYFTFGYRNEFIRLLTNLGYKSNFSALQVNKCNWDNMIKTLNKSQIPLSDYFNYYKNKITPYDTYIYILSSPIEVLRGK